MCNKIYVTVYLFYDKNKTKQLQQINTHGNMKR